jgi:hypothetical protein
VSLEYRVGDVFERMAEIPDGSIDLIVTSPPFLALRSYLPADHPDKGKEIGSEATPADFLDTLLALSAEWGRVLAPHGSLCVELGDTFSGSGGAGGDYNADGMRAGQGKFDGSAARNRGGQNGRASMVEKATGGHHMGGNGWPLAKSLTGIPTLYAWSLAYGRNLLTGQPSPAGQWRIRNLIVWARPNPPVGALGDKFRPATSYITVACRGAKRYFDLDAVRTPFSEHTIESAGRGARQLTDRLDAGARPYVATNEMTHAGAPPLDWHADHHPEDGDWLWKLSTQPYSGSHYATFPMALPKRLIEAMCPLRVCTACGRPSERITSAEYEPHGERREETKSVRGMGVPRWNGSDGEHAQGMEHGRATKNVETLGWSDCRCVPPCPTCGGTGYVIIDRPLATGGRAPLGNARCTDCGHNQWRTGVVLDPFAGSGTTLEAAQAVGRHAIGIDLDPRNADLARSRVGMFLTVDEGAA